MDTSNYCRRVGEDTTFGKSIELVEKRRIQNQKLSVSLIDSLNTIRQLFWFSVYCMAN